MDSDEYSMNAKMWILSGKFEKEVLVVQNSVPRILEDYSVVANTG